MYDSSLVGDKNDMMSQTSFNEMHTESNQFVSFSSNRLVSTVSTMLASVKFDRKFSNEARKYFRRVPLDLPDAL